MSSSSRTRKPNGSGSLKITATGYQFRICSLGTTHYGYAKTEEEARNIALEKMRVHEARYGQKKQGELIEKKIARKLPRPTMNRNTGLVFGDKSFLYFVEGAHAIKIGITDHIEKRMNGLQSMCPIPLSLVVAVECSDPRELEKRLHAEFDEYRMHGEWFAEVGRILQLRWLLSVCKDHYEVLRLLGGADLMPKPSPSTTLPHHE